MGYIDTASMEADSVNVSLPHPEWIVRVKAAKDMVDYFPRMLTEQEKTMFHVDGDAFSIIQSIKFIATDASKCKALNSIDFLTREIRTLEGFQRITYYNAGDVVFVTVPGRYNGQKVVTAIFSLTDKLGRLESIRRAAEKSGQKTAPMGKIRKLRKNSKARGFFAQKN